MEEEGPRQCIPLWSSESENLCTEFIPTLFQANVFADRVAINAPTRRVFTKKSIYMDLSEDVKDGDPLCGFGVTFWSCPFPVL